MKTKNILFICRANCFRSRVAEVYFRKINKNKNIKTKGAGPIAGHSKSKNEVKIAKEFGININGKPKGITAQLLKWTDLLIIVTDDVPSSLFKYEKEEKYFNKIIRWEIKDIFNKFDKKGIRRAIKQVMKKVEQLNKQLEKENKLK